MSNIDDYLMRIDKALVSKDLDAIRSLAYEINGAFTEQIKTIGAYERDEKGATPLGLRQIRGKLVAYRNSTDEARYGTYGLSSITDSIRQLEDALSCDYSPEELEILYKRIDHTYSQTLKGYTSGLCGWNYTKASPGPEQTRLRMEKLRFYRDEEYRKLKLAEVSKTNVSMTQSASNANTFEANIAIDIATTIEQIDALPESSLSDTDKTFLKGMIADLTDKDSHKRETKLQKLTQWLSDKGIDVFIAVMPYIVQIIKTQMGI